MATIVEDGTGVMEANAYIPIVFADMYHVDRNHTDWAGTTARRESAIIRASMYVDSRFGHRFRGFRQSKDQGLEWPRVGALDNDGYEFSGTNAIPKQLQRAVAEYALRALQFGELAPDVPPSVPRQSHEDGRDTLGETTESVTGEVIEITEQVGPILTRTKYQSSQGTATPRGSSTRAIQSIVIDDAHIPQYPAADLWMEELLQGSRLSGSLRRG